MFIISYIDFNIIILMFFRFWVEREMYWFYHEECVFFCLCPRFRPKWLLRCIRTWYFSDRKFRQVGTFRRWFLEFINIFQNNWEKKKRERNVKMFNRNRKSNPAPSTIFVTHYHPLLCTFFVDILEFIYFLYLDVNRAFVWQLQLFKKLGKFKFKSTNAVLLLHRLSLNVYTVPTDLFHS